MTSWESVRDAFEYSPESGVMRRKSSGKVVGSVGEAGYCRVSFSGRQFKMHRIVWFFVHGVWPEKIDHINGDRSDNRICNLRNSCSKENSKNQRIRDDNKSGHPGVNWHKASKKWCAQIRNDKKYIWLGSFEVLDDAIAARVAAEKQYGYHDNHGSKRERYYHH